MRRLPLLAIGFMAAMVACGGGGGDPSGVDQAKPVTTLTVPEVTTFCTWAIDVMGGPGHVTECGPDQTVTVDTQTECEASYTSINPNCSVVTVAELENCIEAFADDPCNFGGSACAEFLQCSLGS